MQTALIRTKIAEAIVHEQNTHACFQMLAQVDRSKGMPANYGTINGYVNSIQEYLGQVPITLENLHANAQQAGSADRLGPILAAAESLFLWPPYGIPDNMGLAGLADNAYLVFGFLLAILGQDSFAPQFLQLHAGIRTMLGEPLAGQLDSLVLSAMNSPQVQKALNVQPQQTSTSDDLDQMIQDVASTGKVDPELIKQIDRVFEDPAKMERLTQKLRELGAEDVGSGAPLNIADFYYEGEGSYDLKWPLHPSVAAQFQFGELDRKTQFFVLFQEWSRREMEGMNELMLGKTDLAEGIFQECILRAEQIDVKELLARSYEGLMRVAQKRVDRASEMKWSEKAMAARTK